MKDELPPFNIEAEEALVAVALLEPERLPLLRTLVKPADFFREQNRWIWEAVLSVADRDGALAPNQVTVGHELARCKRLEEVGGPAYLSKCITDTSTTVGDHYYARLVSDTATRRKAISAATHIITLAKTAESIEGLLGESAALMASALESSIKGATPGRDILPLLLEHPTHEDGVMTGWPTVDGILGSMRRGTLNILAARPSKGKTSAAAQIVRNVLSAGKSVLVFSAEMSKTSIERRILACQAGVDSMRIELGIGMLTEGEQKRLNSALGILAEKDHWIHDRVRRVDDIAAQSKAHHLRWPLDLIVVDYLQKLESGLSKVSRTEQVTYIAGSLKDLAMDMGVPVLACSQLSRSSEGRTDTRPFLEDLRESGAIEQDADVVMFLHDGLKVRSSLPHDVQLLIDKNREGVTGDATLRFTPATSRFEDVKGE